MVCILNYWFQSYVNFNSQVSVFSPLQRYQRPNLSLALAKNFREQPHSQLKMIWSLNLFAQFFCFGKVALRRFKEFYGLHYDGLLIPCILFFHFWFIIVQNQYILGHTFSTFFSKWDTLGSRPVAVQKIWRFLIHQG